MDLVGGALVGINAILGLGLGVLLAKSLRGLRTEWSTTRSLAVVLGTYLLECAALAAGMLIPVFSFALALIWGIILGSWLRSRATYGGGWRLALEVSGYSCVPTATLLAVPVALTLTGRSVLDTAEAIEFGIPEFVPWPANTILGFFLCYVIFVSALKFAMTIGTTRVFMKPRGCRAEGRRLEA